MKDYLLFSSIGDNYDKAFKSWYCDSTERNYDIIFVYYGDDKARYNLLKKYCDIIKQRKGSKFQNLVNFYDDLLIDNYKYSWIVDDDISLDFDQINKMFEFISQKQYSLCQPSMHPKGQNSYYINQNKKGLLAQQVNYTNFIEVGCPILNKDYLYKTVIILKGLNNNLMAFGIDYIWHTKFFTKNNYFKVLLNFMVYNPYPKEKKLKERECLVFGDKDKHFDILNTINISVKDINILRIFYYENLLTGTIHRDNSLLLLLLLKK